jgi:acetyl-CoA decarbonylase/synthase complex subunit epsilon
MTKTESWQTAEIPGPTRALVVSKPKIVSAMIKRSKRPLLVVGHESNVEDLGEKKPIDYAIMIAKAGKIPVVATAHIIGEFEKRGFKGAASMSLVEVGDRLKDPNWMGMDGEGQYDLALMTGFPYYMSWLVLSGLKHFAMRGNKYLTTISMDRYYQPHASWSFPNLSMEKWEENIKSIVEELEVK